MSNVCQAAGDPHYRTWDGVRLHYQGLCRHLLAGVCGDDVPEDLIYWDVRYGLGKNNGNWYLYLNVIVMF